MATDFRVTIAHDDREYARQAAAEALNELDRLENLLSRFVPHSEVSQIARVEAERTLVLHPDTYDCLRIALQIEADTHGAFNVAYQHQPPRTAAQLLTLLPIPPSVRVASKHVVLDLGGIGKGFALDRLATVLLDWDVTRFLLRASASTMLAGQPPPATDGWSVRFGPAERTMNLRLRQAAFSGSGTLVRGNHIVDPHTGRPATHRRMAWAGAATAAAADAISTALMVMDEPASRAYCQQHPDVIAYSLSTADASIQRLSHEHTELFR